ncbi:methionyl-tRNA formyltransferase [Auraticoccus sp. F435]|uniref:Methionyl-tRNA formyltransferase n=1 Tax=Auraticoccus cholistanensis TaxID=2656650 RepID=A0A6A9USW4_9ACTN|nr:methionyl-tRNA formyltransferase [Auraticoccus cholistanensis]
MRLVFAGTPEVAVPSLDALLSSRHEVVAVVTRPDAPAGRGKRLTPSPVAQRAEAAGLRVLKPEHPRDPAFVAELTGLAPDCCPVVAYGALVPQHVLDVPRHGWVNLHFSLLPAWRGAAPVQHAVLHGDTETGATTFRLVKEMDAGPVFGTVTDRIGPSDTSGDLLERLSRSGAELLVRTLDEIEDGTARPVPQPEQGISLAPKISVADAELDWSQPAEVLDRVVRGCQPAPGAWTTFRGERFKVASATVTDQSLLPGQIAVTRKAVLVGTGTTALELGRVQPPGKKAMPAADWARGVQLAPDEVLGPR